MDVYLEVGKARTLAAAVDWPGWCRGGRDEASALQALLMYAPRYARVLADTPCKFQPPGSISELVVVERLTGNATTDFGAPALALPGDSARVEAVELERWQVILSACWQTLDAAVQAAEGKPLRTGPRGGGRDLAKIMQHVLEVDAVYLTALGGTLKDAGPIRSAILHALGCAVRGELPARGPRGGARWSPRYFVRRLAWHELDHAWEIEDRIL